MRSPRNAWFQKEIGDNTGITGNVGRFIGQSIPWAVAGEGFDKPLAALGMKLFNPENPLLRSAIRIAPQIASAAALNRLQGGSLAGGALMGGLFGGLGEIHGLAGLQERGVPSPHKLHKAYDLLNQALGPTPTNPSYLPDLRIATADLRRMARENPFPLIPSQDLPGLTQQRMRNMAEDIWHNESEPLIKEHYRADVPVESSIQAGLARIPLGEKNFEGTKEAQEFLAKLRPSSAPGMEWTIPDSAWQSGDLSGIGGKILRLNPGISSLGAAEANRHYMASLLNNPAAYTPRSHGVLKAIEGAKPELLNQMTKTLELAGKPSIRDIHARFGALNNISQRLAERIPLAERQPGRMERVLGTGHPFIFSSPFHTSFGMVMHPVQTFRALAGKPQSIGEQLAKGMRLMAGPRNPFIERGRNRALLQLGKAAGAKIGQNF